METTTKLTSFPMILAGAIADTGITKEAIADEMGVHIASVYRILAGTSLSKPKIINTVRAVNKLAMYQAISETDALRAEGYDAPDEPAIDFDEIIMASIIDLTAQLPAAAQSDVLAIVKALHDKHAA